MGFSSGLDTNPGTESQPYKSIAHALKKQKIKN